MSVFKNGVLGLFCLHCVAWFSIHDSDIGLGKLSVEKLRELTGIDQNPKDFHGDR
jgi:hypothetical protein